MKGKPVLAVRTTRGDHHQAKSFRTKTEAMPWVSGKHLRAAWVFEGGKTLYRKKKSRHAKSR